MLDGYVKISRRMVESAIWRKPPLYLKVWLYLLFLAQYKPYKGLGRGQLRVTVQELQEACAWYVGYRRETPTRKQIYSVLKWLRNPGGGDGEGHGDDAMIAAEKEAHGLVVTICNYGVYQAQETGGGNARGRGGQAAAGARRRGAGAGYPLKEEEKKEEQRNDSL